MAPVTILAIRLFAPVRAAYLTLVACPSMHPYRAGVALKYGMTEGLHRKSAPQKFSGEPVGEVPPDRYASDGWLYQIQDLFYVVDYLVCVYEDDSKVNYPLPDKALRGLGRCDFVQKWNYPDSFDGEAIRDWSYAITAQIAISMILTLCAMAWLRGMTKPTTAPPKLTEADRLPWRTSVSS
jgi:hypothetical protein